MTRPKRSEVHQHEIPIAGRSARIDVPLRSRISMRRVAEELRGLAHALEKVSWETDEEPAFVMLHARDAVRRCNQRMAAIRPPGRPKSQQDADPRKPTKAKLKSQRPALHR